MRKHHKLTTNLAQREIDKFNRHCESMGIDPARKIGDLMRGFLVAEGVIHQVVKTSARRRQATAA